MQCFFDATMYLAVRLHITFQTFTVDAQRPADSLLEDAGRATVIGHGLRSTNEQAGNCIIKIGGVHAAILPDSTGACPRTAAVIQAPLQ